MPSTVLGSLVLAASPAQAPQPLTCKVEVMVIPASKRCREDRRSCGTRMGPALGLMRGERLVDIEVHVHDEADAVWTGKREGTSWFGGLALFGGSLEGGRGALMSGGNEDPGPRATLRGGQTLDKGSKPNGGSTSPTPHPPKLGSVGVRAVGEQVAVLQAAGRWPCPRGPLAGFQLGPEQVTNQREEGCIPRCSLALSSQPKNKVYSQRVPAIFKLVTWFCV